ncbi:MAG TPA: P-loop NTPase fold protein, partial [Chthoniobacterales bacterium]
MKLHPPKIQIDAEQPFKEAFYNRQQFAASLTALLRNVTDNLVVFVNAPWGEGKTTFARMWEASLRGDKLDVIYFDAYAADYFEDPFLSFSGEILELAKKRFPNTTGVVERREFKKTAIEVGKRLGGLAFKVGVRAATMGAVEAAHLSELKEIASNIS